MKKIIDVPGIGDRRFKKWTKTLKSVDTSKSNGYAFEGDFLRAGSKAELPVGTHILAYGESGSMKYHSPEVVVYRVSPDAENGLEKAYEKENLDRSWALDVREEIAEIVNADEKENPLATYSTEELMAELKRREEEKEGK